jgi:hypothetical protein
VKTDDWSSFATPEKRSTGQTQRPLEPCFDPVDATNCLQQLLDQNATAAVHVPNHNDMPWIVRPLWIRRANLVVTFAPGVVILAKAGSFLGTNDVLLSLSGAANVSLLGLSGYDPSRPELSAYAAMPTLRMRKASYTKPPYALGEWRHGIWIGSRFGNEGTSKPPFALPDRQTSNCVLSGLRVETSGGDGFYIQNSTDVTVTSCDSNANYRQGLSVIDVSGLTVADSSFRNTDGTGPSSGIDFEPMWHLVDRLSRMTFSNIWSVNNSGIGFEVELSNFVGSKAPLNLAVTGLHALNNTSGGLMIRADAELRGM